MKLSIDKLKSLPGIIPVFTVMIFLLGYFGSSFACDMMALISLQDHTISEQAELPGEFDDPIDFFEFMMERSDPIYNDDGYGVIYYKDVQTIIDSTQKWFKIGNYSWYGDGEEEPLDDAVSEIMSEDNNAVIVLGHDRQAGAGYGSHPFSFEWQDRTFSFMHNGTVRFNIKNAMMHFLGEEWFVNHPSNWSGEFGNINSFIDSELLFHYLMSYIIEYDGEIVTGIHAALNNPDLSGENLRDEFSRSLSVINFVLTDGSSLYTFRNSQTSNTRNLCYEIFDGGFIGIKSISSLNNIIYPMSLVCFHRDQDPIHYSFFNSAFSADPLVGNLPLTVNFTDGSGGDPLNWDWDFQNDGIYDSEDANPTFTYTEPGIYSVKLKTDDGIFTDSLIIHNYITVLDENGGSPIVGLQQNFPNPFNSVTYISYVMKYDCRGNLTIFNVKGQKIKSLFKNKMLQANIPGFKEWNGRDEFGKRVTSGIYIYQLETNRGVFCRKMVLVK